MFCTSATLDNWDSLRQYGINALTGEADAYCMRLLCDVSAAGKKLIEDFFGNTVTVREGSNWNSSVGNDPAVGSILLPYDLRTELGAFIGLHVVMAAAVVVYKETGNVTFLMTREDIERFREIMSDAQGNIFGCYIKINMAGPGSVRGRNVHQFSGRVE